MPRPRPEDHDFWEYAMGDTGFAIWIRQVDELCIRFLDTDLLSIEMVAYTQGLDLRDNYQHGIKPGEYLAELLEHLKAENGIDMMETHVARMAKWGVLPHIER